MKCLRDSSTIDLRSSWADAKFATEKLLLVDKLSISPTDSIVGDEKYRVLFPCLCQVDPDFGVPVACPKP